jgi:hypothetical protein
MRSSDPMTRGRHYPRLLLTTSPCPHRLDISAADLPRRLFCNRSAMSVGGPDAFFATPGPPPRGLASYRFVPMDDLSDNTLQKDVWRTRASHVLERALMDPTGSKCPFTLLGCLASLGTTLTTSSERTDNLWTAIIRFLSLPRSCSEILAVLKTSCFCDEETRVGRLHRAGEARYAPFKDVYRTAFVWTTHELFRILEFALAPAREMNFKLWRVQRRTREAQMRGGRSPWPQSSSQLLPHGPEDTFGGLIAWFAIAQDRQLLTALFEVLHAYLAQCPMVVPFIVNSSIVAEGLVRFVDVEEHSWKFTSVDIERRLMDASHATGHVVAFLSRLFCLSLPTRLMFLRRMPGPLLRTFDKAMTICDEQRVAASRLPGFQGFQSEVGDFHRQRSCFFLFALDIMLWLPPLPERAHLVNAHRLEEGFVKERDKMSGTPVWQLEDALKGLESQQHCARLGCKQTFLDQSARFRYCAACRRVPYCSELCAKASALLIEHRRSPNVFTIDGLEKRSSAPPRGVQGPSLALRPSRYPPAVC